MATIDRLKIKRGQLKTSKTRFRSYVNSFDSGTQSVSQLKLRKDKFEDLWNQFDNIQSEIELLDQTDIQIKEREEFEDAYFEILELANLKIANYEPNSSEVDRTSNSYQLSVANPRVRLPKIELPKFNGIYENWYNFRDTFNSLIHSNSTISAVEKFNYLKSCLMDEAAEVIHSLEISEENYKAAWDMLNERYDNKRLIIQKHIHAIHNLPICIKENYHSLRMILDGINKHVRALESLKRPTEHWDDLIIYIITTKLDTATNKAWESTLDRKQIPSLANMTEFLAQRCQILDAVSKAGKLQLSFHSKGNSKTTTSHIATSNLSCPICDEKHTIYQCNKFLQLSIEKRFQSVKRKNLCINCLRSGHVLNRCSSSSCKKCNKRHNTLLHRDSNETNSNITSNNVEHTESKPPTTNVAALPSTSTTTCCGTMEEKPEVLLATAKIIVYNSQGEPQLCRAVLDSCSQSNFITERLIKQLRLPIASASVLITGINKSNAVTTKSSTIKIQSRYNSFNSKIQCLILNKITDKLPIASFKTSNFKIPENLKLADPEYNISSEIDILIGAELFWDLLCTGKINTGKNMPTLLKTQFGWIISGKIQTHKLASQQQSICNFTISQCKNDLTKFWNIEEYSPQTALTREEKECESHYSNTYRRNEDGRFIVQLPFKPEVLRGIGDTFELARKRFYSLERNLNKHPEMKLQYSNFIHEYHALGHMKLSTEAIEDQTVIYLPHHGVMKQGSSTTKLRVVFDASAKSSTGISLNNALMVGPTLQEDLISIILRFRTHRFAVTADVTKMYRQVLIEESQTSLQRILWRDNEDDELKSYDLKTVTYGTASASYLAIRSLQQLAKEEEKTYPVGALITCRDFYVDDLLTGANTLTEATKIINEVNEVLKAGGFNLCKWTSNNSSLVQDFRLNATGNSVINLGKNESTNTLGLQWNVSSDCFQFLAPMLPEVRRVTKRNILSNIARLFDPLGLLAPIIIVGKLLIQKIWQLNLNWDEAVPLDVHTTWINFKGQLHALNSVSVPRWIINNIEPVKIEIHGFCDASEVAFGACIYIRVSNGESNTTTLICAKSRVAPIKSTSLPRLELCGAIVLARLVNKVNKALNLTISKIYCWTDSTIVLAWINSNSRNWKTFIANRVSEIQDLTSLAEWRHVSSQDNPADMISRGMTPVELIPCNTWWKGPKWLVQDSRKWPTTTATAAEESIPERRTVAIPAVNTNDNAVFFKFSNFDKLIRIFAYCLRYINNLKVKRNKDIKIATGPISVEELMNATTVVIRRVQNECFSHELIQLSTHGTINSKNQLKSLSPFLDKDGILRVGGRLRNATQIAYDQKHPILLPKDHVITKLIIARFHLEQLHAGTQNTLAAIRLFYWPINGKNTVKRVIRECITCFKAKPIPTQHLMGDLPTSRVTFKRPFANCGIDYFGPLHLREGKRRNKKIIKGYGALFVCMATKALHIELVSDLTTEAFIGALKRFISRRGKPSNIYSDNATNFVGADNELRKLNKMFTEETSKIRIVSAMQQRHISWHFIPPRSPHFGGIWEAAVKSVKHHITRIVGNAFLTFEEMATVLTQIEAVLNSRPLTPLTNDPNDFSVLTPAHFLIGDSLSSVCEPELLSVPINRLSRWQYLECLRQQFWRKWHREYLSAIQARTKWKEARRNLEPGQMVLVKDDNTPTLLWPVGRIEEVHTGSDGIVRVATIRTSKGAFKRAVVKLCPLPPHNVTSPIGDSVQV